jgi:hypothetical protein
MFHVEPRARSSAQGTAGWGTAVDPLAVRVPRGTCQRRPSRLAFTSNTDTGEHSEVA